MNVTLVKNGNTQPPLVSVLGIPALKFPPLSSFEFFMKRLQKSDTGALYDYCQAQPQLQLSRAEIALISSNTPTTNPPHRDKY